MKFTKCPRCNSMLRPAKNLEGGLSKTHYECTNSFCPTVVDNFQPLTMQYNFMKDPHKRKGVFGGFASGKSFAVIKDVQKHCEITPNAYVAVIGFTYRQIKRNFKKDFDEDTPAILMKKGRNEKTIGFNQGDMTYTFQNGAKIELITADEEGKIRGMNATKVVFLEVSNVAQDIFELSKSRNRNMAASKVRQDANGKDIYIVDPVTQELVPDIEAEWTNITMESNPEANWINKEFLLKAEWVQFYGSSYNKYQYRLDNIDPEYSLHISATDGNPYLPKNYLEINTAGKPPWEVKRFYYGSFLFSQNMVYPRFNERLIDPYPIPWKDPNVYFIIGYDYGISDLSAFVFGFVNFKINKIIFYDELGVKDLSVKEIAKQYREKLSVIPDGKLLNLPAMDAKSYNKRGGDKNTIGSLFEDVGLYFEPTQDDPDVRTMKLNSLIDNGQVWWFRTMTLTTEEFSDYKFVVNSKGEVTNKRVDKRNHFCDATEFALVRIPFNLEKMTISHYIQPGMHVIADKYRKQQQMQLTNEQKFHRAANPLDQNFKNYEEDSFNLIDYSDDEIDSIINKLSGI